MKQRIVVFVLIIFIGIYGSYAQNSILAKGKDLPSGYIKDTSAYSLIFKNNSWIINMNSNEKDTTDRYRLKKHFTREVNFSSQNYITPMYYNFFVFDSLAAISVSHFKSRVDFFNADFNLGADFLQSTFDSAVSFSNVHFKGLTNFSDVTFRGNATFLCSHFHGKVLFISSKFYSYVNFESTHFKYKVDFSGSYFGVKPSFENIILPDTMVFQNVKSEDVIDLTSGKLDSARSKDSNIKCKILLEGTDIGKIKINYDLFNLYFTNGASFEQKLSVYEKLLKKFKDEGLLESYKNLDIEYREFKYKHDGDKFLNWFHKYWWNYGYNKELVLWWSLIVFLIFTFINIFLWEILQKYVYEIKFPFYDNEDFEKQKTVLAKVKALFRKKNQNLYFVVWLILMFTRYIVNPLIYTAVVFFGIKLSLEGFKKFSVGTIWIFLIYVVGIFCLAYIVNILIVK